MRSQPLLGEVDRADSRAPGHEGSARPAPTRSCGGYGFARWITRYESRKAFIYCGATTDKHGARRLRLNGFAASKGVVVEVEAERKTSMGALCNELCREDGLLPRIAPGAIHATKIIFYLDNRDAVDDVNMLKDDDIVHVELVPKFWCLGKYRKEWRCRCPSWAPLDHPPRGKILGRLPRLLDPDVHDGLRRLRHLVRALQVYHQR